jgi:hypothetical protein
MASNTNPGSPGSFALYDEESRASAAMSQGSGRVPGISSEHLLALQASSAFQSMDLPANQFNHQMLSGLNKRSADEGLQERASKKLRGEPNCGEGNGVYPGHATGGLASMNLSDPYQMFSMLSGGRNIEDQSSGSHPASNNLMLHSEALMRAGLSAQYMQQEQASRNSALLASLTRPQSNALMSANPSGMGWSSSLQDRLQDAARTQQLAQFGGLNSASDFLSSAARRSNSAGAMPSMGPNPYIFAGAPTSAPSPPQGEQLQDILRRLAAASHQRVVLFRTTVWLLSPACLQPNVLSLLFTSIPRPVR